MVSTCFVLPRKKWSCCVAPWTRCCCLTSLSTQVPLPSSLSLSMSTSSNSFSCSLLCSLVCCHRPWGTSWTNYQHLMFSVWLWSSSKQLMLGTCLYHPPKRMENLSYEYLISLLKNAVPADFILPVYPCLWSSNSLWSFKHSNYIVILLSCTCSALLYLRICPLGHCY